MISVVTTNDTAVMSNPYPGMNLAEACESFTLESNQMINDLEMSILLNEHSYLYENGVEISYVNEKGETSEKGKELINAIRSTWEKFMAKASELWDKLITNLTEFGNKVLKALLSAGISKKHVKVAVGVLEGMENKPEFKGNDIADYSGFKSDVMSSFTNSSMEKKDPNPELGIKETSYPITGKIFEDAANCIFDKEFNLKDVKAAKKDSDKFFRDFIKNTTKDEKDDLAQILADCKAAIAHNNAVMRYAIKGYNARFAAIVKVVKTVFTNAEVRKAISADVKQDVKELPGKAAAGAKKAGETVKSAPSKAKSIAADMKAKAEAKKAANKDSVKESADVYDGKFFRV